MIPCATQMPPYRNDALLHRELTEYLKKASSQNGDAKLSKYFTSMSDDEFVSKFFSNVHGRAGEKKGLRLTKLGVEVMQRYFTSYEAPVPADESVLSKAMMYLHERARMPYYVSNDRFVLFERDLGIKLKLADGSFRLLQEIDDS